jgi:hypothetical protein
MTGRMIGGMRRVDDGDEYWGRKIGAMEGVSL